MEGIVGIVVIFFVLNSIFKLIKKATVKSQQKNQPQTAAAMPQPKPAPKPADFRFPPIQKKPATKPVTQEGRDPGAKLSEYTPIKPSADLSKQFSTYKGSLGGDSTEGEGYKPEAYDPVEAPYRTQTRIATKVLPDTLNSDALLQAVVMSEILKRPGVRR